MASNRKIIINLERLIDERRFYVSSHSQYRPAVMRALKGKDDILALMFPDTGELVKTLSCLNTFEIIDMIYSGVEAGFKSHKEWLEFNELCLLFNSKYGFTKLPKGLPEDLIKYVERIKDYCKTIDIDEMEKISKMSGEDINEGRGLIVKSMLRNKRISDV